jgi:hypothetical protein
VIRDVDYSESRIVNGRRWTDISTITDEDLRAIDLMFDGKSVGVDHLTADRRDATAERESVDMTIINGCMSDHACATNKNVDDLVVSSYGMHVTEVDGINLQVAADNYEWPRNDDNVASFAVHLPVVGNDDGRTVGGGYLPRSTINRPPSGPNCSVRSTIPRSTRVADNFRILVTIVIVGVLSCVVVGVMSYFATRRMRAVALRHYE